MGFFSYLFGTGGHKAKKVNINEYKYITRKELLKLVPPYTKGTVTQQEAKTFEEVLLERLSHYNKISLHNIKDILHDLNKEHLISEIDAKYLYKTFEEYFSQDNES